MSALICKARPQGGTIHSFNGGCRCWSATLAPKRWRPVTSAIVEIFLLYRLHMVLQRLGSLFSHGGCLLGGYFSVSENPPRDLTPLTAFMTRQSRIANSIDARCGVIRFPFGVLLRWPQTLLFQGRAHGRARSKWLRAHSFWTTFSDCLRARCLSFRLLLATVCLQLRQVLQVLHILQFPAASCARS